MEEVDYQAANLAVRHQFWSVGQDFVDELWSGCLLCGDEGFALQLHLQRDLDHPIHRRGQTEQGQREEAKVAFCLSLPRAFSRKVAL